jgi:hypothetical protein
MNQRQFDLFTSKLSRSALCLSVIKPLACGAVAAGLGRLGLEDVAAACKSNGKKCGKNSQCCSKKCKQGKCRCNQLADRCQAAQGTDTCCGTLGCFTTACSDGEPVCCRGNDEFCQSACHCCNGQDCDDGRCCVRAGNPCAGIGVQFKCCPGLSCINLVCQ